VSDFDRALLDELPHGDCAAIVGLIQPALVLVHNADPEVSGASAAFLASVEAMLRSYEAFSRVITMAALRGSDAALEAVLDAAWVASESELAEEAALEAADPADPGAHCDLCGVQP
jgi:hypothetical protein